MKWGDKLEMLEQVVETTGVIPPALQQRPYLTADQDALYKAFLELSTDRTYSQAGAQPIGLRSLLDYSNLHNLDRADAQDLWRMIRQVDDHWRKEIAARNPAPGSPPAKTSSKKR